MDTATDRTVVLRRELDKLGLPPFLQAIGPHVRLWDIPPGTALYRVEAGLLGQFSFHGCTVLGVDPLTNYWPTEMSADGILGMERVFLHFGRICLVLDDAPRLELHDLGSDPAPS